MGPIRTSQRSHVCKLSASLSPVPEALSLADDPELEAILKQTENKMMDCPDGVELNRQRELEAEEENVGTPVSVYLGCLVPSPMKDEQPVLTTPLCRRAPDEIKSICKSRERFMKRLNKIKRQTLDTAEAMTKTRAARDVKRIYRAMQIAKAKLEPFCIKHLFERESDVSE